MRAAIVVVVLALARVAAGAPAADLVVYWAPPGTPPAIAARAAASARGAGAGFLDHSPASPPRQDAAAALRRGRDAYEALRFEEALTALDEAAATAALDGAAGLSRAALGELFLFRGLARVQRGDDAGAWDDLVIAARIDPVRVLDPGRFPPRAIEAFTRAQGAIAGAAQVRLAVVGAGACTTAIDGDVARDAAAEVAIGAHWIHVRCPDRPPWGQRLDVGPGGATVELPAIAAPADDAFLIQARAAGARAVIVVAVTGALVSVRKLAIDGRALDRRTVEATAAATGAAVTALLAPRPAPARWYRSRWIWAAAGATAVAAVLVPLLVRDDDGGGAIVLRPAGLPPW